MTTSKITAGSTLEFMTFKAMGFWPGVYSTRHEILSDEANLKSIPKALTLFFLPLYFESSLFSQWISLKLS